MWREEIFGWVNVLAGFAWFIKILSFAINLRGRSVVKAALLGIVVVGVIHLALSAYFASFLRPIYVTFWNAIFVVSTIVLASATIGAAMIGKRYGLGFYDTVSSTKENDL